MRTHTKAASRHGVSAANALPAKSGRGAGSGVAHAPPVPVARQHHDFSRLQVLPAGPLLQRKLMIDDEQAPAPPVLRPALERLAGRPLVADGDGGWKFSEATPAGGSPTIASYIGRAIDSKQTYRLRWAGAPAAAAAGAPAAPVTDPGTVEMAGGEVAVNIRRSHLDELTWTADEIIAEKIVEAVARFDPSGKPAPPPALEPSDAPLPPKTEDELLSTPLAGRNMQEKQDRLEGLISTLPHLSAAQKKLAEFAGVRARGVPFTEILRGVESNLPFRTSQEITGDRVKITYLDPRLMPAGNETMDFGSYVGATYLASRVVTFVAGADEATAPASGPPKTGSACTAAEQADDRNSCCTADMLAEVAGHLATARAAVARTIERLEGTALIDCNVSPHFKTSAAATLAKIVATLRIAQTELYLSRHGWKCRPKASGLLNCTGDHASYVGGAVRRGDANVALCVGTTAPFSRWTTVLHEVMHRVGIVGTETYRHETGVYPGADPLQNADSYAGLVDTLGSADWSPCRVIPWDFRAIAGAGTESGFMFGARLEMTPLGPGLRVVDWTLGADFLWTPQFGVLGDEGDDANKVLSKGYAGVASGIRLNVPNKYGSLVFDAVGGIGVVGLTDDPSPGGLGRVGARWRFGDKLSGPEAGVELSRLQTISKDSGGEWIIGISLGYHIGKSGKRD